MNPQRIVPWLILIFVTSITAALGQSVTPVGSTLIEPDIPPPNFKIAFIGDQGFGLASEQVLNLIKSEGAQAVVHMGDFDYGDNPKAWDEQINKVLGPDLPYFSVIGNHDRKKWSGSNGYQHYIKNKFQRLGLTWHGDLGVQSSFKYKGIFFVMVAPGVMGSGHDSYIRKELAADYSTWRITAWHKNMNRMQAGGKEDETGWGVYEEARKGGAIIVTGHEHSYSRTHLLSNISTQTVASTSNDLTINKGTTFVLVSGLGGRTIRRQRTGGPWWATIYASDCQPADQACKPNANHGALFAVLNVDGQPNKGIFYFKDIDGKVIDRFTVFSNIQQFATKSE